MFKWCYSNVCASQCECVMYFCWFSISFAVRFWMLLIHTGSIALDWSYSFVSPRIVNQCEHSGGVTIFVVCLWMCVSPFSLYVKQCYLFVYNNGIDLLLKNQPINLTIPITDTFIHKQPLEWTVIKVQFIPFHDNNKHLAAANKNARQTVNSFSDVFTIHKNEI